MNTKIVDSNSLHTVLDLLRASSLPYQDIELKNNLFIIYHDDNGKMIGSGGLEFYSSYALLRSLAVVESERGKSFGKEIVSDLFARAQSRTVKEIYLLTETASDFFKKIGFADIARDAVPNEIKTSTEFKSVCPVSAACMIYRF
jgi:amino-acid N-acetyltransferase